MLFGRKENFRSVYEGRSFMQSLGLNFDFSNLSGDNWADIEDVVGDTLMISGLDENYYPNEIGVICDAIIDKIPK